MTPSVQRIDPKSATLLVVANHYLHRKTNISFAFGLFDGVGLGAGALVGAVTFGAPASHAVQKSACATTPKLVMELNRLWVDDVMPRNSESWFVARAIASLPPPENHRVVR